MRRQIKQLLEQRGEITFGELCRELNCFTDAEIADVRGNVGSCRASQLGEETRLTSSTLLFPRNVGFPFGDGVDRHPERHGIPYIA